MFKLFESQHGKRHKVGVAFVVVCVAEVVNMVVFVTIMWS